MHHEAIEINPEWGEQDFAKVQQLLVARLAHRIKDPFDTVIRHTTFERKTWAEQEYYVANYDPPSRAVAVAWPIQVH